MKKVKTNTPAAQFSSMAREIKWFLSDRCPLPLRTKRRLANVSAVFLSAALAYVTASDQPPRRRRRK